MKFCDCLDTKFSTNPREDVACIIPQPNPECKKCGGSGYLQVFPAGPKAEAGAGFRGVAFVGAGELAKAGDGGVALAGNYGHAEAGFDGIARVGHHGTAIVGHCGYACAGNYSTAKAGCGGIARAGVEGTAEAGDWGTASAHDYGTAVVGCYGRAHAGIGGVVAGGLESEVYLMYKGPVCVEGVRGVIGENGLKPNVKYKLGPDHSFVEIEPVKDDGNDG